MSKLSLKEINKVVEQFENVEEVKKAVRSVQSQKSRLKKQKAKDSYNSEMNELIKKEQILKEVRQHFEPKKKFVTDYNLQDIQNLDYDETIKAIKSIQSKKTNTQFLTDNIETNKEYQNAIRIEEMLQEHKKNVKPIEETVVRKSDIENLISHIEDQEQKIDKDYVVELLKKMI